LRIEVVPGDGFGQEVVQEGLPEQTFGYSKGSEGITTTKIFALDFDSINDWHAKKPNSLWG
jgi:hypothetical protein